jgi:uncharacterized protein DUF4189
MRTGALAWLVVAAALTAATLGAGVGRERAWAEGAIAVGSTGDVVRDGIAFGMAIDMSKDAAGEIAVQRCRTFEAKAAAQRCQVVATFSGECFAIAYDLKPGTPGAGWGVGSDQLVANQKAVAMCEQAAGPSRKGYCQVERFGCDTGPKLAPKPEGQTDAVPEAPKPDAKPAPGIDAKPIQDAKVAKEAKVTKGAKDAKDIKEAKVTKKAKDAEDIKEAEEATDGKEARDTKEVKEAKEDAKGEKPSSTAEAPPPPVTQPTPKPELKPKVESSPKAAGSAPAELGWRGALSPLLPVLALAGVGLAYAVGQHLRGRVKGGLTERQILTGAALAVAAAIAIKVLDMAGAGSTVAAALAGLIALGAALLA